MNEPTKRRTRAELPTWLKHIPAIANATLSIRLKDSLKARIIARAHSSNRPVSMTKVILRALEVYLAMSDEDLEKYAL